MLATILPEDRENKEVEALRICNGFGAGQWAAIDEPVEPALLAHGQAEQTRAAASLVDVPEPALRALLALDLQKEEDIDCFLKLPEKFGVCRDLLLAPPQANVSRRGNLRRGGLAVECALDEDDKTNDASLSPVSEDPETANGDGDQSTEEVSWEKLFQEVRAIQPKTVTANTYRKMFGTASGPVLLACDDGNHYVVKGRQALRQMVNDQVVGRLGAVIGAPVGEVCFVRIASELIQRNQAEMGHIPEGLAHGSQFVSDCEDSRPILYHDLPANRMRYALIAVLYGWTHADDRQYSYSLADKLVYSFDHGHFLGGPDWRGAALSAAPAPALDPPIVGPPCNLTETETRVAKACLGQVTRHSIATAIASIPDDWGGLTIEERLALADALLARCLTLRA